MLVYPGALLSLLVEPVYWSSVVIGSLYHRDHMTRAVFGRIQLAEGSTLPVGYRLARPMLSAVSQPETRLPQKAPSHAVSWLINSSQTEILNIMTGKQMNGDASQLCKAEMFRLFAETWNQLNSGEEFPAVYADVKKMADDYQAAKIALYKALRAANLGCWMERPVEQDHFVLPK